MTETEDKTTRERLLEAATRILAEEGLEALSMRRLGAEVGISQAAIYRHFQDKAELVTTLVGSGYTELVRRLEALAATAASPAELVGRSIETYVDFALGSPAIFKAILLRDAGPARAQVNSLSPGIAEGRRSFALLVEALRQGMESGDFAPAPPELTAQAVWTALFGLAARLVLEPGIPEERRRALVRRHSEIIVRGLRP